MSKPTYIYTYCSKDGRERFSARVTINDRGEHDGKIIYLLEPVDGVWPHRPALPNGKPLIRAITLSSQEEREWLDFDLVEEKQSE